MTLKLGSAALALALITACNGAGPQSQGPSVVARTGGAVSTTEVPATTLRVHYHRNDATYAGWGVYSWNGPAVPSSGWPGNRFLFGTPDADAWGQHADIPLNPAAVQFDFLISLPNADNTDAIKDCPQDQGTALTDVATMGNEVWVVSGDCTVHQSEPPLSALHLGTAFAVWLTGDTLVWPGADPTSTYALYTAANGGISSDSTGAVTGAEASYGLTVDTTGMPATLLAKFPQYAGATVLRAPSTLSAAAAAAALKGELVVTRSSNGAVVDGTQVQSAPMIDFLYAAAAKPQRLGLTFAGDGVPTFRVWAPTAKSVLLNVFDGATATTATTLPMVLDATSGVWSYNGGASTAAWTNRAYYTFTAQVYSRAAHDTVVSNTVSDPYSVTLNANGQRSMVLNLADPSTRPGSWPGRLLPTSATPTDATIYELHIRDFSANDPTVPAAHRGKYLAFSDASVGMLHLKALAFAGLTHIHLLPSFDFDSVDEITCVPNGTVPASTGAGLEAETFVTTPDTTGQAPQNRDCYNWGYDPFHYGAPDGSYSSDAGDGLARVIEVRRMVQSLHASGLRVIMDVVYNHTSESGQGAHSILDQLVPGYYYRQDASGVVEGDSCCEDTAPEFAMMEKLMTDTLVQWADQYKIDGFRFDIMGFIPKAALLSAKAAVETVTAADGRGHTYFYGEGFNFGHVANGALFVQSSQLSLAGSGIGSFNDRIRDAVRGGGPFDSGAALVANQGFINGLCYDNNDGSACTDAQRASLLTLQDRISIGLAGNLASFPLNATTTGDQLDYFGQPTGYTGTPQENISYISVHDGETVWDISQYKHPAATSSQDRARAQVVGLSIVALSQGVPFFHAGDDLLRSRSEDSNAYNSGDYFNRIFWDGSRNNWSVGAPPLNTGHNGSTLAQMQVAMTNPNANVGQPTILAASLAFADFLAIRRSSSMFRLATAAQVNACVKFPDQVLGRVPGLIVMQIGDGATSCGDNKYKSIVVLFNASKTAQTFTNPAYVSKAVTLHPFQAPLLGRASFDRRTGTFAVPPRTTTVFVQR
jgi:pullulanase-type alpha-1,6-glucosidase